MTKIRVLFLCVQNTSRSQMAEGLLRHMGGERFDALSAGVDATVIRPETIVVMRDIGIDVSAQYSKSLEKFINEEFDYVITVCSPATEACPYFPNAKHRLAWDFEDPAAVEGTEAMHLATFTLIRDEIAAKLQQFMRTVVNYQ